MLLAELEIRHTRANLPTRRVALGTRWLPVEPAPGFGGILLAGVIASRIGELDEEELLDLFHLVDDLQAGKRIAQPRLRHRFQSDTHGLDRSRHKLHGDGELVTFDLDDHGAPVPQVLGAAYAAARVPILAKPATFDLVRKAVQWRGPVGSTFITYLSSEAGSRAWRRFPTDPRWALAVLGFRADASPSRRTIQRHFRDRLRDAHPDAGAESDGAGLRILELTEARRILLDLELA